MFALFVSFQLFSVWGKDAVFDFGQGCACVCICFCFLILHMGKRYALCFLCLGRGMRLVFVYYFTYGGEMLSFSSFSHTHTHSISLSFLGGDMLASFFFFLLFLVVLQLATNHFDWCSPLCPGEAQHCDRGHLWKGLSTSASSVHTDSSFPKAQSNLPSEGLSGFTLHHDCISQFIWPVNLAAWTRIRCNGKDFKEKILAR